MTLGSRALASEDLRGSAEAASWILDPGIGCRVTLLVPAAADGSPPAGQHRPDPGAGPALGLPARLPA
ncbi:MAG TPA: hypothetical protein VMU75_16205 [Acidimicrobiales bacterium]|nr:hypothetical protein [Acidimicrobiales bacterium]